MKKCAKTAKEFILLKVSHFIDKCSYCPWKGRWHLRSPWINTLWLNCFMLCCRKYWKMLWVSGKREMYWITQHATAFTWRKKWKWTWDEIELWELRWKGRKDGGVYTYRIVRVLRGMRGRFMKKENMRRMPSIYKE